MKKTIFFLICIITFCACGQALQKKSDSNTTVADTTVKNGPELPVIDPTDSLKIRYIPEKVKISRKTLQQQRIWMEAWKTAVKENRQEDAFEALEKAASYDSGEACYKLAKLYKTGNEVKKDQIKSDSLFYYSAVYGYKPGIEWLNSGEGAFMLGAEIPVPQFPGGERALMQYIRDKTKETFKSSNGMVEFQGRVIVLFIVEKDGSIQHAKVVRNSYYGSIEKDVIDIIKNMPKWKPATWQGQPVRSFFICPVVIKLM